jgi:hypothetical protein
MRSEGLQSPGVPPHHSYWTGATEAKYHGNVIPVIAGGPIEAIRIDQPILLVARLGFRGTGFSLRLGAQLRLCDSSVSEAGVDHSRDDPPQPRGP